MQYNLEQLFYEYHPLRQTERHRPVSPLATRCTFFILHQYHVAIPIIGLQPTIKPAPSWTRRRLTDVTRLNFFEVARAGPLFLKC